MHFLQPVVAASALASIVTAAPCPAPHTKRSSNLTVAARFTVPQGLPRLPGRKIAGPVALERAYGKYAHIGATLPRRVRAAASTAKASDDGTVEASPLRYDHAYLSPVTVGGQTLNLGFDTGSSDL